MGRRTAINYFAHRLQMMEEEAGEETATSDDWEITVTMERRPVYRVVAIHASGRVLQYEHTNPVILAWRMVGNHINLKRFQWDRTPPGSR